MKCSIDRYIYKNETAAWEVSLKNSRLVGIRNLEKSNHSLPKLPKDHPIAQFLDGRRSNPGVPVELTGTDFQKQVWAATQKIPVGKVISYGELARRIRRPKAARAVGQALGKNPVMLAVPCHRVVGSNGSLTGFGGGLPLKKKLLKRENA
jgi:methylated-DNA-[protein]-cysteine S-methyltransferase